MELEKGLLALGDEVEIIVISDFQMAGCRHEADYYREALEKLGGRNIREIREFPETLGGTIGQVEIIKQLGQNAKMIVISTFAHYPRVRWLCRELGFKHYAAFGIPRLSELISDSILTFLFPLLNLCGGREWFKRWVGSRQEGGRL